MNTKYSYINQPNLSITAADGTVYAYREIGEKKGIPVIFFTHLSANLDNLNPRVVDGIDEKHWVIAFDNKGIGLSSGTGPRGGEGIKNVTKITNFDMVRAIFMLKDIKSYLFFYAYR